MKRITSAESRNMTNQRERLQAILEEEEEEVEINQRPNTIEDFWRPIIQDEYSAIRQPAIEANNFEMKPAFITMVQQHQFTSHPSEDPNEHMRRFMRMANTVKLNGVRSEVIKLQLLREELVEAYMSRFFPLALIAERRGEIIIFKQGEDESLYTAWERFKRLLKRCPMHEIDLTT